MHRFTIVLKDPRTWARVSSEQVIDCRAKTVIVSGKLVGSKMLLIEVEESLDAGLRSGWFWALLAQPTNSNVVHPWP